MFIKLITIVLDNKGMDKGVDIVPEQFNAKKTRRSHSVRVFSARKYRGGGGQKTRLESELLSAKKRHKGSQRARGLVATLVSKPALRHLT